MANEFYDKDAERARIGKALCDIVVRNTPADINVDRVMDRAEVAAMLLNTTRTGVMAALVFAAMNSRFVGLETAHLHAMLNEVDEALEGSPYVTELQQKYAEMNQKTKEAQAVAPNSSNVAILVPGNNKVH
tara:strand:- start:133 stop:525 length:393 start_codon:yes stop_codon:yes gene_type:complete